MAPSDSRNINPGRGPWQGSPRMAGTAQSQSRRNEDSWVEISSQPSSSSLSSIGDEIVTTGLRIGGETQAQRRRRLQQHNSATHMPSGHFIHNAITHAAGNSSQEEYDETESEEDRLMSSSAEDVQAHVPELTSSRTTGAPVIGQETDSEADDDDDEATALGKPTSGSTFRPQPNAFSHPPSHLQHRHSTNSSVPHYNQLHRPSLSQRSYTRPRNGSHPHFHSPSYREDNDEALRASLTTLLSCAAAARGMPKRESTVAGPSSSHGLGNGVRPGNQPLNLQLVPESDLMGGAGPTAGPPTHKHQVPSPSNYSAGPSAPASTSSEEKTKRAASSPSKPPRATKKKRTSSSAAAVGIDETTALLSPTLLTWVVSAGVVVLVSVVGFGAGYVIGREVGRQEALGMKIGDAAGGASNVTSCGREAARSAPSGSLRRFRWGSGMGKSVTA